jgi:hypothetical protein
MSGVVILWTLIAVAALGITYLCLKGDPNDEAYDEDFHWPEDRDQ